MRKPNVLAGALWGALLTIPLMAVMFMGMALAGLPFSPFETFEWIARALPGGLITFGIDTMVDTLIALGLSPADASKPAEVIIALGMFVAIGAAAGLIFFAVMNATQKKRTDLLPGLMLGAGVGVPLFLMALAVPSTESARSPLLGAIWVIGQFVLWGYSLNLIWNALAFGSSDAVTSADASIQALDRRSFLVRMGAGAAVVTVTGAGVGALLSRTDEAQTVSAVANASSSPAAQATAEATALPNAGDAVTAAPGTRLEVTPLDRHYRIDINVVPPRVEAEGYTLPVVNQVNGANETLRELTLDEIRAMPATDAYITMSCISNRLGGDLISTIQWTGVRMQHFLEQVGIPEGATHLRIMSADGFDETVALEIIANDERVMLAWAWENQPLTQEHGFPLRIHIPGRYGMKQPKWITLMEFLGADDDGYWVRRGWDKDALVRATSVIDTVALDSTYEQDGQTFVPVGGIAWAADRGISRVQVRVDEGEWQDAQLRTPISDRTWTIWRYDWAFQEGTHTFEVRCEEGDGTAQIETFADVRPSGATGIVSYRVNG